MATESQLALAGHLRQKAKRMRREAQELVQLASALERELADTTQEEETARNGYDRKEARSLV
jgi:hypothetical protein